MMKINALSQAFKAANLVKKEKFDSWAEDVELVPGEKHTVHGLFFGTMKYTAVFSFERCKQNAVLFSAFVLGWIKENDPDRADRGLGNPSLTTDVVDSARNITDIDIEIEFEDDIYLVETVDGEITYDGKQYSIGNYDLWTAETATVSHGADQ